MRCLLLASSLLVLIATLAAGATNVGPGSVPIRRVHQYTRASKTVNLTSAQLHAADLTHRRPTRRSTARLHRRSAVGDVILPTTPGSLTFKNANTGSSLGQLSVTSNSLTFEQAGDGASVTTTSPSGAASGDHKRIYVPSLGEYANLGFVQYSPTSGLTVGPGLSNGLLLTGIKNPGTSPLSTPVFLSTYINPSGSVDRAGETDIWNINFVTGEVTAIWINPDGDSVNLILITNGVTIAATGDFNLFNNLNGDNWFTLAVTFPV